MHQTDPSLGELSFELLAEIAVGTTARIELCRVVEGRLRGELVVVKRLHPHIADDQGFVDMFRDEVWMTAALKHPHAVEVVGWGQDARGPWLAVEFVRGVSLQRLMKTVFETGEQFTERMIVYLGRCICDGLAEAHGLRSANGEHLKLVHRDLTPGNVLLGFDGQVKIADFGLAKAKQRLTKTLTGLLKGQPQYMSPEQVHGSPLDGRSDVFAMGVTLFELFTGRRPWNAATDLDAMRAITDDPPADLLALRPKIDKALVEVVNRCLAKDPSHRYQSAAELRDRFQQWLDVHGYRSENDVSLARFVRRNAMRQMRWFERATAGEFADDADVQQQAKHVLGQPVRPVDDEIPGRGLGPLEERTRDERPSARRAAPKPRAEAKTRLNIDDPPTESVDIDEPDSIDWGEEGPTLIQKTAQAQAAIQQVRRKAADGVARASRRQRVPSLQSVPGSEGTTKRRRLRQPIGHIDDEDSSEIATRVAHPEDVLPRLGSVAPPDPDVPPLPGRPGPDGTAAMDVVVGHLGVNDTGATRPVRPNKPLQAKGKRAVAHTRELAPGEAEDDSPYGAMPAPRFPSDPSLSIPKNLSPRNDARPSSEASAEPVTDDFGTEAVRLSRLAKERTDASKTAAQLASVSRRAAGLAGEAAMMAGSGQQVEARRRLREAQELAAAVARGEVPPGDWGEPERPGALTFGAGWPRRMPAKLARRFQERDGTAILVLGVTLLVALVVLVVLIFW